MVVVPEPSATYALQPEGLGTQPLEAAIVSPRSWPKPDAMMETADQVRKGVRAKIIWVPSDPTWTRRGVYFEPNPGKNEDGFFLKVYPRKDADKNGG